MISRIIFLAIMVLGGFTSCVKQPYLFSARDKSYEPENEVNASPASENLAPTNLSVSLSTVPDVSSVNPARSSVSLIKTNPQTAKTLFPDTLKPDILKTKPIETKTEAVKNPVTVKPKKELPKKKNQWIALGLALLFSPTGIHRFYLGRIGSGIVQLLINVFAVLILSGSLGPGGLGLGVLLFIGAYVWNLVDIILIATGGLKPDRAEYKVKI